VLTAAIAAVVLNEQLTSYHLVGGALTLAGVLLAELWRPREKPAVAISAR
jgi:drug/metabolite transporter (DMT)-like permease